MNILIACERSGIIRDAFIKVGHDAMSCDLVASARPGPHHTGSVLDILNDGWDMMIAHPDCTYMCSSGLHWNNKVEGRSLKTQEALQFVRLLMVAPIKRIAIENPVGRIGTAIRKADQYIQPYEYGHDASKRTGLWLKCIPELKPTLRIAPRIVDGKKRWANQTDSGQNRLGPSEDRAMIRAETYQGWADAMADQWS